MKTHTLLMYEEVPEKVRLHVIPDDTIDEAVNKVLLAVQGKYEGTTVATPEDCANLNLVFDAVCPTSWAYEYLTEDLAWRNRFAPYAVEAETFPAGTIISKVIRCGYMM